MYFCSKICSKKMQQILQHFFVVTCWVQDSYFFNTKTDRKFFPFALFEITKRKRRFCDGKNGEINMLITD